MSLLLGWAIFSAGVGFGVWIGIVSGDRHT